ncbi:hypothetical protein IEQ34_010471 [Dendrobium chrysotoxum]|uniref:Uncharacterized protein n=1 Tax=Dendrobium chrysotoxum TaxID=161865 RepID=A0AAV7GVW1_DENCH|nr:hypothetical protein IEQ34_010471 [Dendrobium chrysotoxum]
MKSAGLTCIPGANPIEPKYSTASRALPKYKHLPSAKRSKASNIWNARLDGWCTDATTALPFLAIPTSISTILPAAVASSPDVGSSTTTTLGFNSISCPIETLFLSPPETPLTNVPPIAVSVQSVSPSSPMTASTDALTLSLRSVSPDRGSRSIAQ